MTWPMVSEAPIAMMIQGSILIMFEPDKHAAQLVNGQLDPNGPLWLVRTDSRGHALAGWYRCSTGRGLLEPRKRPSDRAPPPQA